MSRWIHILLPLAALCVLSCRGGLDDPTVGHSMGEATARAKWLELPETSATDGLDFFYRSCSINGKALRNYSFYWDYTSRVSRWVAYPLCSAYLGASGRTEAWGYDPLLPAAKQSNVSGGLRESDNGDYYARGLQLSPAHRSANDDLNSTVFYSTNVVPMDDDFSRFVWPALDEKILSWAASSDTLYVVSGCVTEGAEHYVTDRSNNRVTVPAALFKAVLRYVKDATVGHNGYMAVAFWYNHEACTMVYSKAESLSVADLEEKLGYGLFVNLDGIVGANVASTIKSEDPRDINWWWQ